MDNRPAVPVAEVPTVTEMAPLTAALATVEPVAIMIKPEFPDPVVPEENTIEPDTSVFIAFAVRNMSEPDDDKLPPEAMKTPPPVADVPEPARMTTDPPAVVPEPAVICRIPPVADVDRPELRTSAPPAPVSVDPTSMDMEPPAPPVAEPTNTYA